MQNAASTVSKTDNDSVLSSPYRTTTIGMVALISLVAFEAMAVAAAMPTVAQALDGLPLYALAFGGTLATSVIGLVLAGRWSDLYGPVRPLWAGLGCFVTGLILAGLAVNMPMLLAGRLVQGLGAGGISVALYVLVARCYPATLRPKIFAAFSAGWVVPSLIGPGLSGLVVEHVGWRWVFLAVPALALPAAWLLRPALRGLAPTAPANPTPATPVRWAIGAALGVCALYLGGQQHRVAAALIVVPALAMLGLSAWKLLPTGTLRAARGLPSVIAMRGVASAAFFGSEAFLPLLLSRERGLSPSMAGIALSIGALGWFCGSWYQGHNRHGWTRRQLLRTGTAAQCVGIVLTALAVWPKVPVIVAVVGWSLTGLGMGLLYASLSVLTLALSPPAQQGANTSALQICEAVTVASALAVGGSLFSALLMTAPQAAYLANFGLALAMAALGTWLVGRTGTQ